MTCLQKHMPFVLVDNGSAINVCPWREAKRFGIRKKQLLAPSTHLSAYDNSKRLVLGTILLPIIVGRIERNLEFHVLSIPSTFNLILGRPWLHDHQAHRSTLHLKMKILINGQVVTIEGIICVL